MEWRCNICTAILFMQLKCDSASYLRILFLVGFNHVHIDYIYYAIRDIIQQSHSRIAKVSNVVVNKTR